MAKLGILVIVLAVIFGVFFLINNFRNALEIRSPIAKEKPLDKYTFSNLKRIKLPSSNILLGDVLDQEGNYTSQMFHFKVNDKKVSGLLNTPASEGTYPVIIMLRGFVSVEDYETGVGTKRAGEVFAQNGFITLAPDFLGYGQSDKPSNFAVEERFQTYTTTLSLLSSLENLNSSLDASYSGRIKADISRVGIWGHSNGGQIALSILEITGKNYPTVLWAPVSKPFPYSILYFTDEFDDHGKALRKVVANFENDYNIELYSPNNFYSWINASIEIHQGTADDAVPFKWSDQLVADLKKLEKDATYFIYPGSDHNLLPGWDLAVQRSLNFYRQKLL